MNHTDLSQIFVRAKELRAALSNDYHGELLSQFMDYFSDAETMARNMVKEEGSSESHQVLNTMINAFISCQTTLALVWKELHPHSSDLQLGTKNGK